jgi:K+-transporting ATPase KdpF subunit
MAPNLSRNQCDLVGYTAQSTMEIAMVSVYVLALLVVLLVVYLFYAVINPEKF